MFIYGAILKSFKSAFANAKMRSTGKPDTRKLENKRRSTEFVEGLASERVTTIRKKINTGFFQNITRTKTTTSSA